MAKNSNLQDAKKAKFDEFYTLEQPIHDELYYYTEDCEDKGLHNQFKGKTVLCNCDDPEWSNFWKYFVRSFEHIGITRLISTHYEKDNKSSYVLKYFGEKDADGEPIFKRTDLQGNGDFRSEECLKLLDEADIVVTNPPFSIFREYINTLIEHKKEFVILGNMNNITYKDVFPHIKEGRLRLGVHSGSMEFRVPDYFEKDNVYEKDGVKYAKFGNICWYTNLEHYRMHEFLELNATYKGNEEKYPKYDNYDAIEVGKIDDIPSDYDGTMGVPITILQYFNADQFKIEGLTTGRYEFECQPIKRYEECIQHNADGTEANGSKMNTRATIALKEIPDGIYYTAKNSNVPLKSVYVRVLVRRVS